MLSCREVVELLTDFLEDALPPARRDVVLAHLQDCDDCLRYVAQLQEIGRLLAELPTEGLSEQDRDALVRAYREWCVGHTRVVGTEPAR
jgi:anti-sigma factor RsiW